MPAKPMLDDLELQQVQKIEAEENESVTGHRVPALEGDFLQDLGRRAVRIALNGVLSGDPAADGLKKLREKFQKAEPIPFVADVATATSVDKMLIEDLTIRELAGKPERFEYSIALREFIPPPQPEVEPPPPPPPPSKKVDKATLIVEVIVEGQPNFDFSTFTVTVKGKQSDGTDLSRTLTNRKDNVWTEEGFPPGQYTAKAVVETPQAMSNTADATLQAGQTAKVTIILHPGAIIAKAFIVHFWFDKAFIEPCLREVLSQVAEHAQNHPNEKLIILGHTDLVGSGVYNQSLSERRGRSVFAYLTFGRDHDNALAEWNNLRQPALGQLPTIKDTWATREYQYVLQDLDFYQGNVDGLHGPVTAAGVRAFQQEKQLPVTGFVDDPTWSALIEAYLSQDSFSVPKSQFFGNCGDEIVKWLGAGEQDPVVNTENAERRNRRTELLFVNAGAIPCPVPKPVTFKLPAPGFVNSGWCAGPDDGPDRDCFLARDAKKQQPGQFLFQPAEPGDVSVRGSIMNEDGTPLANAPYVLIAPDGENMNGERPTAPQRGTPIPGRTKDDGSFSYPDKPKGVGIYILEVQGPFVARLAEDPPGSGKGPTVCKRLDGSSDFNVVVSAADPDPARKLRATIFDHFGQPRKQTQVQVVFSDGTQSTTTSNDIGEFVVEMQRPQDVAKIRYQITDGDPGDVMNFTDFFVNVEGVDSDEGVRRRLHNLGYKPEDDLKAALLSFQATQGLVTTGEVDDQTREKLVAVHEGADPLIPAFSVSEQQLSSDELNDAGPPL
jgi:outer membrane protein OmpA-like peptidoglycan-associated protein